MKAGRGRFVSPPVQGKEGKCMALYTVRTWGGNVYTVEADNGTQAKRLICKRLGRVASAPLIGIKGMTANRVK